MCSFAVGTRSRKGSSDNGLEKQEAGLNKWNTFPYTKNPHRAAMHIIEVAKSVGATGVDIPHSFGPWKVTTAFVRLVHAAGLSVGVSGTIHRWTRRRKTWLILSAKE